MYVFDIMCSKTIPPNDDVTEYFKNQIHHFIGSDTSSPLYTELQRKSDVPTKPHPQNTHIHISRLENLNMHILQGFWANSSTTSTPNGS